MDSFDKREEGFERAFSHQEELRFRVRARRNRKLGQWAGEKRGLEGTALTDYATAFADRALESADDEPLVAALVLELAGAGVSEHRIRRRFGEFSEAATREIQAGR